MSLCRRAVVALGTLVDISIDEAGEAEPLGVLNEAIRLVHSLEDSLSAHRPDSELNQLCARAHLGPVRIGRSLRDVLSLATAIGRQSRGIFDVSRPTGTAGIKWHGADMVSFARPASLDLGGIAKGYVVDRVVEHRKSCGVSAARVNAGGDFKVFGNTDEPVAVRFSDGFRPIGSVRQGAVAVSTSQRHVNGRSGARVCAPLTVVVFAPRAIIADALTKIPLVCLSTMRRLAHRHGADWRLYPFTVRPPLASPARKCD